MPKRKRQRARGMPVISPRPPEARDDSGDELMDMVDKGLEDEPTDFLARLNPRSLVNVSKKDKKDSERPTQRKRARNFDESEAEFETRPRASDWTEDNSDVHYFLPLKAEHGRLIHQPPLVKEKSENEDHMNSEHSDAEVGVAAPDADPVASTPLTVAELFAQRQIKLAERRDRIAELASGLVEDPETNISYLKRLRDLCTERDPDVAISVRKLAIISLTAVFKDIAPSYHIRELTEAERAVKVKKEVRKLRNFEEGLLSNYQAFLSLLDDTVKLALGEGGESQQKRRRKRNKPLDQLDGELTLSKEAVGSLGEVSLQSLCQLLVSLSHFNFRNNLITVIVPRMASRERKVNQLCCETVETLFKNDQVGDVSLEAVQMISKMVKAKSYKTKPAVLDTLLYLRLSAVDEPVRAPGQGVARDKKLGKKKEVAKLSKKQRKHLKEERRLDRDLQETSAIESRDKRSKMQTEILSVIFTMYFRILKHSRHSPLLPPVLRGLAKFAHLISVDFFSDLMSVLHSLAESGGLTTRECMQCVSTAFAVLSGQGSSLTIDPRQFYVQLYGALLQLDACSSHEDISLAVECLDTLIRKRRQISLQRVLAFVKRLSTVSLQLLPGACLAVMATIRAFLQSYQQTERLLDVESVLGGGVFRPDIPDPEMCHASSTLLWELTVFKHHYSGAVRTYASHLLAGAPSQGRGALKGVESCKTPAELLGQYPTNPSLESVMTGAPPPQPHPRDKHKGRKTEHYYTDRGLSEYMLDCEQRALQLTQHLQTTHSSP